MQNRLENNQISLVLALNAKKYEFKSFNLGRGGVCMGGQKVTKENSSFVVCLPFPLEIFVLFSHHGTFVDGVKAHYSDVEKHLGGLPWIIDGDEDSDCDN